MAKVVTVGATVLFACILCATPLSLRLSPEGNVALSVDSASAEIGRPLTAGSVAGVHRRAHRRAYRRWYDDNYGYGYGTYQPSYGYGYAYEPSTRDGYYQQPYSRYGALACGKELQKQCGGVPVLANNMLECIQKSQGKISPRCVALANNVVRSCERDALQHCQAIVAGQSNILGCLRTATRVVSSQCGAALDTAFLR
jgi:hypothetical protein